MKPSLATAATIMIAATISASADASAIARSLVAPGGHQRQDRRGDHRPERGIRAEHQDP